MAETDQPGAAGGAPDKPEQPSDGVLRIYPPTDGVHADKLAECSRAFARGDFGGARRLARAVLRGSPTTDEQVFAGEILRRTAIDPVALGIGLGCFVLFWLVIYLTVWRH